MGVRFNYLPELPDGVEELFALTKYRIGYATPRFSKGARVPDTGGFKVFTADGACVSRVIPIEWTLEQWREMLGKVLDADLRWKNGTVAELFKDPKGDQHG